MHVLFTFYGGQIKHKKYEGKKATEEIYSTSIYLALGEVSNTLHTLLHTVTIFHILKTDPTEESS